VLATAATGELSEAVADNAGLVTTHAYAVLDVRYGYSSHHTLCSRRKYFRLVFSELQGPALSAKKTPSFK
jgi:hypothetical protein